MVAKCTEIVHCSVVFHPVFGPNHDRKDTPLPQDTLSYRNSNRGKMEIQHINGTIRFVSGSELAVIQYTMI